MSKKNLQQKSKGVEINKTKHNIPWSLVILAVAILFRVIYFFQFQDTNPVYGRLIHDSALFNKLANSVIDKSIILDQPFYISPFYIYFLALIYTIFGYYINTIRVIQFAAGALTALMTYGIANKYFDKRKSVLAGILAAVYMPFMFYESNLVGTSMATFFTVSSIYLLLTTTKNRFSLFISFLSGLSLALAITSRPNLLLLVPIPFIYYYLTQRENLKKAALPSLLLFIGLAIPLLLTGIHNKIAGDSFSILTTHGGINFFIGNHENASGAWEAPEGLDASVSAINLEQSKQFAEAETGKELTLNQVSFFWYKKSFSFILHHPIKWSALMLKKTALFWSSYETPLNYNYYFHQKQTPMLKIPIFNLIFYMPFAIIGIIVLAPQWRKYWLMFATILAISLSIIIFFMASRYRMAAMPFLIILTSVGIWSLLDVYNKLTKKHIILFVVLLLLFAGQTKFTNYQLRAFTDSNEYYNLALSYLIEGNPERSVFWGKQAVYQNPGNANAFYNLGIANLKMKNYDDAYEAFNKVIQLEPDRPDALRNLGSLLLLRKQYQRANRYLAKSIELEPGNKQALMNLGLSYYHLKEYDNAIKIWNDFLRLEPGNEQAQRNIQAAEYSRDH